MNNSSVSKILIPASQITAATFLSLLFQPDDWITFRLVQSWEEDGKKQTKVVGEFCHQLRYVLDRDALQLDIIAQRANALHANFFFGVNPRPAMSGSPWKENEGSFDFAAHIGVIRNLYCDLDYVPPDEAARITPTPTIVLCSGNGSHVYWRLREPTIVPHSMSPVFKKKIKNRTVKYHAECNGEPKLSPEAQYVSNVLVGLSAALKGDHCTDLARLLRVPGVYNYKNFKNGQEPKPVFVHTVNEVFYDFADFQKYATPVLSQEKKATTKAVTMAFVAKANTQPTSTDLSQLQDAIRACADATVGNRSELDYALVCRAVQLGLDPDAVWNEVSSISKFEERTRESYFDKMWEKQAARQQDADLKFAELDAAVEGSITKANPPSPTSSAPLTITEAERNDPRFAYLWRGQHGKRLADAQRAARIRSLKEVYDLTPPGFHAYLDWASPATDAAPIFHLGGCLAIASTLLNRRVWLDIGGHKVRPQMWVAILAESSLHRKSTAAGFATSWLLRDAVYCRTLLSSAAFSMEGIYSELGMELGGVGLSLALENCRREEAQAEMVGDPFTRGVGLFTPDEMGSWLSTLDASYNRGAKKIVTEWYDFGGDYFHKTLAKGNGYFIYKPFVNVIASSTVDWINAHAQEEDLMGGFFPRWLFLCNWHSDYRLSIRDPHGPVPPVEAALAKLKEAKGAFYLSPEAEDLFADWDQRFAQIDEPRLTAWVNRLSVMAQKVALIFAASDGAGSTVEARHMLCATGLIDRTLADLRRLLHSDLAFTEDEKNRNKVIRVLQAKGVVPHAVLLRTTRLPARELKDILQTLEEQEMVATEEVKSATKDGRVYRLVG